MAGGTRAPASRLPGGLVLAVAFTASGVAGLSYELAWTRYLALLVGHSAYAQVLVLAVFLGGTAVGSLAVADRSRTLERPLRGYAAVEVALGAFGLLFHPMFLGAEALLYRVLAPALGEGLGGGLATWGLAVLLILPQAVLLGATFPLMTAGWARRRPDLPGRSVADVYLLNTLGGAAGILIAGFVLVPALGLPGTTMVAGLLNLTAAALVWPRARAHPPLDDRSAASETPLEAEAPPRALVPLLLGATLLSALASFLYEVGWIRMLSLVLGSATHAFELMLSAFLVGIAAGSFLIRGATDRARLPLRLLGGVQWAMGVAALLTLPLYVEMFPTMGWLVRTLPRSDGGYLLFNLSRYGIALIVMLPATLLAGMTLPLLTATLLRGGAGERAIGQAYGANTLGSVVGAVVGGLFLLPLLGLKGLLAFGAALDMAVGVALMVVSERGRRRRLAVGLGTGVGAAALVALVVLLVRLDQAVLTSGVYRLGTIPQPGAREMLFYRDGATATVAAHRIGSGLTVLTTNGKPDASLPIRWLQHAAGRGVPVAPISGEDESTQVVGPLVTLAHNPGARQVAVIGQGSGMSSQILLGSPTVESVVTIEIEPAMITGSEAFLPANRRAFEDPRSRFLLDDARSALAGAGTRYDAIFSEPSNPWVSGVASLFTVEFYERVRERLAPGGMFGQWLHVYEMEDDLILSVLAAIDESFADWSVWTVGVVDLVIVASDQPIPEPDWGVATMPGIAADLAHAPPLTPGALSTLRLLDAATARPLLRGIEPNTDFRPTLDAGAERARFLNRSAEGFLDLSRAPFDLNRVLASRTLTLEPGMPLPITGVVPIERQVVASWLAAGPNRGQPADPRWVRVLVRSTALTNGMAGDAPPPSWTEWTRAFVQVEGERHGRSSGWVDTTFYREAERYLEQTAAPDGLVAAVALLEGIRGHDMAAAAAAADRLGATADSDAWLPAALRVDAGVAAYLAAGRPADARRLYDALVGRSGRTPGDLRNRILDALIREALGAGPKLSLGDKKKRPGGFPPGRPQHSRPPPQLPVPYRCRSSSRISSDA